MNKTQQGKNPIIIWTRPYLLDVEIISYMTKIKR